MTPRRDPVPRAREPWHWLGGLLVLGILGAGLVAAALLLWEHVDIRRLAGAPGEAAKWTLPEPLPPAGPARAGTTLRAALYRSPASAAFFPDAAHYPGLLERWQGMVAEAGGESDVVTGAAAVDELDPGTLLMAPSAVCLGTDEVRAFQRHLDRGGGLLLTWATGARDEACEWAGWDALQDLLGVADIGQLEQRATTYLTVPGGLPLAAGIDPGTRVELRWDAQVALPVEGPRLYWSDWAMNPHPAEVVTGRGGAVSPGAAEADAAAWLGHTDRGGRIVWFGFTADQGARPGDQARLDAVLRNGLWWAAGLPLAEVAPWPGGAQSAMMVAQDVESEFANSAALASAARSHGFPVTFFVVSSLALDFPDLAQQLRGSGEIGSHTSDHAVIAGLPHQEQMTRLRRSRSEIRGWSGDSARGLRPPEERLDEGTLRAWRRLGGSYLVGVNEARGASPEVFKTPDGPVALLPRVLKDDYNLLVQESRMGSRHLVDAYLEGMTKVRALGGLAIVSLHSQVAGRPRRVGAVTEVVDSAHAEGGWWLATGRQIADWWLARHGTRVTMREGLEAPDLLEASVTASDLPLEDAWVTIYLPRGLGERVPVVEDTPVPYRETPWGIAVPLSTVPAGETRTVRLVPVQEPAMGEVAKR